MAPKRSKSEERDRKREYRKKLTPEKCAIEKAKAKKRMDSLRRQKKGQEPEEVNEKIATMPPKRSKSNEKERKQRYRESMTPEKLAIKNEKDKNRKRILRAKKANEQEGNKRGEKKTDEWEENKKRMRKIRTNQSESEKKKESEEAKQRMKVFRANQTTQEEEKEREEATDRMRKVREMKSEEVLEYEKIIQKQRKRKSRENASGKEHLIGNLRAKKGMRLLNSERSLRECSRRKLGRKDAKGWDELFDWEHYECKSQMHSTNLHQMQPDIVQKLNKKNEIEKRKRKTIEREKKEWRMGL